MVVATAREEKKMCGDCGNVYEKDSDEDWLKCKGCRQWWHRECLDLSEGVLEDRYFVFNTCPKCEGMQVLAQAAVDESDIENENQSENEYENENENENESEIESDESENESDESEKESNESDEESDE